MSEEQALIWCREFEVDPAELRQQLAWAMFDLEQNKKRNEVRKDPVSWLYGILRKRGGSYPRPDNYKSPAEIRAEQMKLERERERAARAELEFQQILDDPGGPRYRELLDRLNDFQRDLTGQQMEIALRAAFDEREV